jgi:hypothetical protein
VIETLNPAMLEKWLALPGHSPVGYPDVAKTLAHWIADGQKATVAELSASLWSRCKEPLIYDDKFGNRIQSNLVT